MAAMLTFAVFNFFKYVVRLNDRSVLVLLFYAGVLVTGLSHLILYLELSIDDKINPFIYDTKGLQLGEFSESIGSCTMLAINWLICVTMY